MASDDEDSDDDDNDGDYEPFGWRKSTLRSATNAALSLASRKRATRSPISSLPSGSHTTTRTTPSHSAVGPTRSPKSKLRATLFSRPSTRDRCKPRARQVDASTPFILPDDFHCLHCDFVQTNNRPQDFRRHVANHFRSIIFWKCCGVPSTEAAKYGINARGVEMVVRDGVKLVGGCGRDFGRKDAYKRHLDDTNNSCVGDIDAKWHPGNGYKDFC